MKIDYLGLVFRQLVSFIAIIEDSGAYETVCVWSCFSGNMFLCVIIEDPIAIETLSVWDVCYH